MSSLEDKDFCSSQGSHDSVVPTMDAAYSSHQSTQLCDASELPYLLGRGHAQEDGANLVSGQPLAHHASGESAICVESGAVYHGSAGRMHASSRSQVRSEFVAILHKHTGELESWLEKHLPDLVAEQIQHPQSDPGYAVEASRSKQLGASVASAILLRHEKHAEQAPPPGSGSCETSTALTPVVSGKSGSQLQSSVGGSLFLIDESASVKTSCWNRAPKQRSKQDLLRSVTMMYDSKVDDGLLQSVTHGRAFAICCTLMVVSNSLLIGIKANCMLTHEFGRWAESSGAPKCPYGVDPAICVCNAFFLAELLLRFSAEGTEFYTGRERGWNLFDVLLVFCGTGHSVLTCIGQHPRLPNLTIFRLFRAVRMIQWLRTPWLIRFLHKLTLMITSIVRMLQSLGWALLLLLLVIYLFGVTIAHGIANELRTMDAGPDGNTNLVANLARHYKDLSWTLLTLFTAVSGGLDWYALMPPLLELGTFYGLFVVFYIGFVFVGVLNVVTGIFVESATRVSQLDRDIRVQQQITEEAAYMDQLEHVFREANRSSSDALTWEDFDKHLQDHRIGCYLSTLELDIDDARGLFKLLNVHEADEISIQEFISGCMRLKGTAKSIDLCTLMYEHRRQNRRLTDFRASVEAHFKVMEKALNVKSPAPAVYKGIRKARARKKNSAVFAGLGSIGSMGLSNSGPLLRPFSVGHGYGPWSEADTASDEEINSSSPCPNAELSDKSGVVTECRLPMSVPIF